MRLGFILVLVLLTFFLASCGGPEAGVDGSEEASIRTVEVTREVTVDRTVPVEDRSQGLFREGTVTEGLLEPALPPEMDIERTVGETATLDDGNNVTVYDVQSRVPSRETVYDAERGMKFFVIDAEVCVSGTATEPAYFTPREFSVQVSPTVRRMASVPTKLPALRSVNVEPGDCERGFITFQIEDGERPRAVLFQGTSSVEWEI